MTTRKPKISPPPHGGTENGALGDPTSGGSAFSRLELCALLGAFGLLLTVVWPALAGTRAHADRLRCLSNLGEIGKAFNMWAADHRDSYPFVLRADDGGIKTPYNGLEGNAWFQFAWVSNELRTARVLVCPTDEPKRVAEDFSLSPDGLLHPNRRNNSISYFLTYASESTGHGVLSGDRNIRTPDIGACSIFGPGQFPRVDGTRATTAWDERLHSGSGNILSSNGSAETVGSSGLQREFRVYDDAGSFHLMTP